jgi:sugar fermentation stimulation protein A
VMFYCALHNGVEQVAAAGDIDPRYRETLEQVMEQGVEVMAWRADVGPEGIVLTQALPFALDAPG